MPSVVMKFGGSSVVDATAIDRVCAIVAAEHARGITPVVVVSALGGVTDALLALAEGVRVGDGSSVRSGLERLSRRHHDQAVALGVGDDIDLRSSLDAEFSALASTLDELRDAVETRDAALDAVAATGELL